MRKPHQMPRVAIIAPHFAEYSERLASALSERCTTILFLNRIDRDVHVASVISTNALVRVMPMNRRLDQLKAYLRMLFDLAMFRPDVVIVQEGVRPLLKATVVALRPWCRIALIVHDPAPHSGSDSAQGAKALRLRKWLRAQAHALIVHGSACRQSMIALGYSSLRLVMINHGALMIPSDVSGPSLKNRILMFGRMERYKGVEVLLDAVKILEAKGLEFRLILAGAGTEQARLRDRIASLKSVEAMDRYLTPDELRSEINRASFVVAPYTDATQSGVLAAAMANGRPVVATNVGGLADVVEPDFNGLLVPAKDADALASAIERLLREPSLVDKLAAGARSFAHQEMDWHRIAGTLLDELSVAKAKTSNR